MKQEMDRDTHGTDASFSQTEGNSNQNISVLNQ